MTDVPTSSTACARALAFTLLLMLAAGLLPSAVAAQSGRSTVSGIVFDESDTHGIPGAKVELVGDGSSERLRAVRLAQVADEAGKYHFERVPYGPYEFRVSAAGYTTYSIPLYVASDAHTQLHVQLRRSAGSS